MNDQQIESEIQAKGLTAPRVTLSNIHDAIERIDIVEHTSMSGQVLRWAVLNMRNGFAITGKPSCAVSPANDDAELGKQIATDNAISEAWELLGYELKSKLASTPKDHRDRVRIEQAELTEKITKLNAFFATDRFETLSPGERDSMHAQYAAMLDYSNALAERIEAFEA